jgi:hypothetical protein
MGCVIAVAVGDDDGSDIRGNAAPDRGKPLNELAVREACIDQDASCPRLQK